MMDSGYKIILQIRIKKFSGFI